MSGFAEKIEYPELQNFNEKLYALHMYRIVGFAKKLNVQNCGKFSGKFCILYVRNVWICRKIECPKCGNSTGNCVQYICTECLD